VFIYEERPTGHLAILLGGSVAQVNPFGSRMHKGVEYVSVGLCSVAIGSRLTPALAKA